MPGADIYAGVDRYSTPAADLAGGSGHLNVPDHGSFGVRGQADGLDQDETNSSVAIVQALRVRKLSFELGAKGGQVRH